MKHLATMLADMCGGIVRYLENEEVSLVERVVQGIGFEFEEPKPGLWIAWVESKYGFPVRLTVRAKNYFVVLKGEADIVIPPEWISRKLALVLLAENAKYVYGATGLASGVNGMSVVHGAVCDSREVNAAHMAKVGRTVANQMVDLVTSLYAQDLIMPVAES